MPVSIVSFAYEAVYRSVFTDPRRFLVPLIVMQTVPHGKTDVVCWGLMPS